MKKLLTIAAAVLAAGMLFSGCSKKQSSGPVAVEIWHTYNGTQAAYLNELADRFNSSQSDYELKVLAQDYSGFADAVYNAVANGVGPSLIFNYGSTAVDYVKDGLALDIKPFIEADAKKGDTSLQDVINSLPEGNLAEVNGFADGGIYYLPGCTTGPVLFYNKTILNELGLKVPSTWEELASVSKTIYEKKGIPGFHSDGLVDTIQSLIMQNNLGYIDVPNKKVTFGGDKLVEIYQWYADQCNAGYFLFNNIGKYSSEDFSNGDTAMFSGSCVNDQYVDMQKGYEYGCAPYISAIGDTKFYTGWNRGPVLFKRSAEVDKGTYEFIKFFFKPENNAGWTKANSAVSPYGTTQATEAYQEYIASIPADSALAMVQANMAVSGAFPNVIGSASIRRYLEEALNKVVDGRITAEEAVKALVEDCNKALND